MKTTMLMTLGMTLVVMTMLNLPLTSAQESTKQSSYGEIFSFQANRRKGPSTQEEVKEQLCGELNRLIDVANEESKPESVDFYDYYKKKHCQGL